MLSPLVNVMGMSSVSKLAVVCSLGVACAQASTPRWQHEASVSWKCEALRACRRPHRLRSRSWVNLSCRPHVYPACVGTHHPAAVKDRPMTREERRSLHLHRAIARRLERSPEVVLARARETLSLMRGKHPEAEQLFREWEVILDRPVSELGPALIDPSPRGRELRQVTPFAGVLTAAERTEVYNSSRKEESR